MIENIVVAVGAYMIDARFGEFWWRKHPVSFIGDIVSFFEKWLYAKKVWRGELLVFLVLFSVGVVVYVTDEYMKIAIPHSLAVLLSTVFASVFVARRIWDHHLQEY